MQNIIGMGLLFLSLIVPGMDWSGAVAKYSVSEIDPADCNVLEKFQKSQVV